jgi:hypothetical protein
MLTQEFGQFVEAVLLSRSRASNQIMKKLAIVHPNKSAELSEKPIKAHYTFADLQN